MLLLAIGLPWVAMGQQALPYSYGFEDNDLATDGWTLYGSTSSSTKIYSESDAPEGSYLFKFQWTEQNAHLVSPLLSGTENGVDVTFQYMRNTSTSSYNEKFQVGYTTDETVTDPTQFTYGNEVVSGTQWLTYENTFPAGTKRIAIKYIYINGYYLRLDDFHFNAAASCAKPTNLECTAYTATTATLGWTENGTATNWVIEYGTASDFTGATSVPVSDNPHTLTGLTAETTYYARVKADCGDGDQSDWSNTCEFKPSAAIIIGTGTSTSGYGPLYGNYNNSYDQMIYTASQLGLEASEITNIGFNSSAANANARTITIYMGHTTKSSFSSDSDFVSINDLTEVYSGTWNITAGWNEFELTTPFDYDGSSNLVIALYSKGTYKSTAFYYTATSSNQVVYAYNDSNDPNPSTYEGNWSSFSYRSTTTYLPNLKLLAVVSATPKPRNLIVSNITTEGATVTWTAPADNVTGYQYQYKYATTPTWPDTWNSLAANVSHKDLVALAANTLYDFRVRANYADGDSDPAEIQFTTEATCLPPTGLHVASLTATSVTIAWDAEEDALYQVYFPGGQPTNPFNPTTPPENSMDDWGWNTQPETGGTASWNNLLPNSHYGVWVRRYCGPNEFSDPISIEFDTPCGAYDIPYTYGFEDAAPFACWTPIAGAAIQNNSNQAHESTYALKFSGTTNNMVALPQFVNATNTLRLEFWTRPESATNSSCGNFAVGYMTDLADANSFVAVATYAYNDWTSAVFEKKTVDFANAPENAYIAMRQYNNSSSWYWFVDDVTVKEMPSCLPPTDLFADASTTSAELSWTANSGESAWTLYWKKTTDESYTEVADAANPYTLNGLTPATDYQFFVVANCSDTDASEPSEVFIFGTSCANITSYPWSENFDSYSASSNNYAAYRDLPRCWNFINDCSYSLYMYYPSMLSYEPSSNAHSGSNYMRFFSYYNSWSDYDPQPQYAILPIMENLAGKEITLWVKGYDATSLFKVGLMTTLDASTFVEITNDDNPAISNSYQQFSYVIPADATANYVAIMIEAANSSHTYNGVYIDDITIKDIVYVDTYQIVNTVNDPATEMTWDEFADHVNAGHYFTHSTIELKEDIADYQNPITTMVGTQDYPFTGIFDGKGYSINAMDIESDEAGAAPFHYISNATIKNLGVNGNVTQTNTTDAGYYTAGLVGFAWSGTNTIENCEVNTSITITTLGGGIVGHAKSSTLYLTGCYYAGGINNTTPSTDTNRGVGGLVGWCDNATLYIKNCVYDGINEYYGDGSSVYFHPVACKTGGATVTAYVSNCYYLCDEPAADTDGANNVATTEGRKAYKVTGAEGIIVDLPSAAIHYTCSNIWGDNTGSWNGIKIGDVIYGGEGKTLTLNLRGANGYAADHGTLTQSDGQYTLLMEAYDTQISGVSCPVPYNLAVAENGITNHTATIQWGGEHQGYQLWYRTAANVDGTTEKFNSNPTDWTRYTGKLNETTGTATLTSSSTSWYFNNSNGVFDRHAYSNIFSTSCYKWLVTPSIEVTSGYGLSFDVALTKYNGTLQPVDPSQQLDDKFIVLISTDNKATWTVLRKWDNAGSPYVYDNIACSATGENVTLDLSAYAGTTAYIAFYGESTVSGGDNNLHIDNVAFGTLIPAGSWNDPTNGYLIEANSYTIEGLAAETPYEVEIRGYCGAEDGFSENTDIISFTTGIACPAPSALQIVENSVKSSQVGLSWTNGGAEDWIVAYMADGDTDYTLVNVATADVTIEGTTVTYTLTGLQSETEYVVKVQDNCEASYEGDGTSGWSNEESFTTLESCAQPTNVTVSNVVHYNADVAWTGDSDGFTVKYREAASIGDPVLTEGFENNGSNIPEGWTHIGNGSLTIYTTASRVHNGAKSLRFSGATSDNVVVLPELGAEANTMSVSFWSLAESSTSSGTFQVGYVTNATDASTFQVVGDYNASAHLSYTQETVSLASAPAGARVAFRHTSAASNYWWWIDDIVIGTPVAAGEWQAVNVNGVTTTTTLESLTPGTKYELVVVPSCDETKASESVFFTTISANHKLFITEGYWNVDNNWMPAGAPTVEQDVELRANVTIPSGCVATADIITGTGDSAGEGIYTLTIEDGGQLIFQNDNVNDHGPRLYATVKKNLSGYGAENAETNLGYYLISSPLRSTIYNHTSSSTPNITSTGLLTGNYDFYRWEYDASDELEWRNYKATPFNMTGSAYNTLYGYLYANENDVELTFTGQIEHNYNYGHYQSVRDWSDDYSFGAWWLLGNPFVCTAYVVSTTVDGTPLVTDATTAQPFYKMNGDGNGFTPVVAGTPVAPMEGIFYETTAPTGTYEKVFMSTITPAVQNNSKLNMNLRRGDKQLDNAILVFGGNQQLGKMTFRANSSKIFMPVEGKDYAITSVEGQVGEVPVSFVPENNGTYSLSFTSEEVSFSYLHLIDNMTGNDVNLLETPSYTFDARTTDYESRFRLVFATGSSATDDTFGFVNASGNFCIFGTEGEATVQVIDVLGHVLSSEQFSGSYERHLNVAPGVYMIRLIQGNDVKVQKVVVRR